MLRDSAAIETLYYENRSLFNIIKNFIARFKKAVYKAFDRVGANSEAAKAMLQYADELQALWDNALVGAVHNQQGKGTVAQGEQAVKFEKNEYWHPNMTAYEVTLVERIADRELDTTDNYIDEANKWLYKKTGNNTYFALYSTSHTDNPTVLYACKGKRAENEYAWFMNFLDETESGKDAGNDIQRKTINEMLVHFGYALDRSNVHSGKLVGRRNSRNVGVHNNTPRIRPSQALLECIRNIGKIQEETNKVKYERNSLGDELTKEQADIRYERAEVTEDDVIRQSKRAMAAELTRLRELLKMQGKK